MEFLKRSLPKRFIRKMGRHPVAVVSALSAVWRVGKDALRFKKGEIAGPEFRARTGGHFGSVSGGMAGAAFGAAAGNMVMPGLGALVGAFAGGALGEDLGSRAGRGAITAIERKIRPEAAPGVPPTPKRNL